MDSSNTPTRTISYVGWDGKAHDLDADFVLGFAKQRKVPGYGIRRAIFDAAFGYVNGFPVNAILYFVLTRSLNRRVARRAMLREGVSVMAASGTVGSMPFEQSLFAEAMRADDRDRENRAIGWDAANEVTEDYWREGGIGKPYPTNPYRGDTPSG